MDDLKTCFENMGFDNVKTIFTSGNVIINSDKNEEYLKKKISTELVKYYSYNIDVFIRSLNNIERMINNNPFKLEKGYYNQVFICDKDFEDILFDEFFRVNLIEKETFNKVNGILYWKYPKEIRFSSNILKILSRSSLKHSFTIRTIGTLKKIYNQYLFLIND